MFVNLKTHLKHKSFKTQVQFNYNMKEKRIFYFF